jgi:hypothetical protein
MLENEIIETSAPKWDRMGEMTRLIEGWRQASAATAGEASERSISAGTHAPPRGSRRGGTLPMCNASDGATALVKQQRKSLLSLPASLLSIALTGQRLLDTEFLPRLQVKGVPFDFPDNVLLQNLPFESLERVLKRLALLKPYLSQIVPPKLTTEINDEIGELV